MMNTLIFRSVLYIFCFNFVAGKRSKDGDILLSAGLFEGDIEGVDGRNLHQVASHVRFWENKTIPFQIDERLDSVARRVIRKAINGLERRTCLRFQYRHQFNSDYVYFTRKYGCSSPVGYQSGGRQDISVGFGCETVGIVQHLIMHTLGFWHEQSRSDRDTYLLVDWDNVIDGEESNFVKYTLPKTNHFGEPFDYKSIMFMSPFAFTRNNTLPTLLSKDERFDLQERFALSQGDVNKVTKCYCGSKIGEPDREIISDVPEFNGFSVGDDQIPLIPQPLIVAPSLGAVDSCRDSSSKCPLWASRGRCYRRTAFMRRHCRDTCAVCTSDQAANGGPTMNVGGVQPRPQGAAPMRRRRCANGHSLCSVWAWSGRCVKGAGSTVRQLIRLCPLACGVCIPQGAEAPPENAGVCRDYYTSKCVQWASSGRCFYRHVKTLCPAACELCNLARTQPQHQMLRVEDSTETRHSCADRRSQSACRRLINRISCRRRNVGQRLCRRSCNNCPGD